MPADILKMITKRLRIPAQVVENVGNRLDRPVVSGVFAREKVVTERFRDEERTLD